MAVMPRRRERVCPRYSSPVVGRFRCLARMSAKSRETLRVGKPGRRRATPLPRVSFARSGTGGPTLRPSSERHETRLLKGVGGRSCWFDAGSLEELPTFGLLRHVTRGARLGVASMRQRAMRRDKRWHRACDNGLSAAADAVGVSRATLYRWQALQDRGRPAPRSRCPHPPADVVADAGEGGARHARRPHGARPNSLSCCNDRDTTSARAPHPQEPR